MNYQIEKNVPVAPPMAVQNPAGAPRKYPWPKMEVGDSFAFDPSERKRIAASASGFARLNKGYKFTVRESRVWRIAEGEQA